MLTTIELFNKLVIGQPILYAEYKDNKEANQVFLSLYHLGLIEQDEVNTITRTSAFRHFIAVVDILDSYKIS